MLIAFAPKQLLQESAPVLRYRHIAASNKCACADEATTIVVSAQRTLQLAWEHTDN
jgi:hypothetical protein